MTTLAVDLAQKMSAACVLDDDMNVLWEDHSMNYADPAMFCGTVAMKAGEFSVKQFLVEDLPFGLRNMTLTRDVLRLQGHIEAQCYVMGLMRPEYVQPVVWMKFFDIAGKGSALRVEPLALRLGYEPPLSYKNLHHQERAKAKKARTDYAAAWLIARWSLLR